MGSDMEDALRDNDSLDFHFVDSKDAEQGLRNGTYYMVITIPEDFSENASTLMDEKPKKKWNWNMKQIREPITLLPK